jgi:putative tributyrin esterase
MSQMELNLMSRMLGMRMDINLILPEREKTDCWRVLWLMHGGHGDHHNWLRKIRIRQIAEERGLAVVMPGVHASCFVNMKNGLRYGDYVALELPAVLRSLFPKMGRERIQNYIAGFSNGGYGSLYLGLSYPQVFGAIGAMAAGDQADNPYEADGSEQAENRELMFGKGDISQTPYSIKYLGRELLKQNVPLPYIFHACGRFDPWLDKNLLVRNFFEELEGNPYHYYFRMYSEHAHTASCRMEAVQDFLEHMGW